MASSSNEEIIPEDQGNDKLTVVKLKAFNWQISFIKARVLPEYECPSARPVSCLWNRGSMLQHTTYRKNNNHEKCAGIGLNGLIFKK
jgi:hypothetical protein